MWPADSLSNIHQCSVSGDSVLPLAEWWEADVVPVSRWVHPCPVGWRHQGGILHGDPHVTTVGDVDQREVILRVPRDVSPHRRPLLARIAVRPPRGAVPPALCLALASLLIGI